MHAPPTQYSPGEQFLPQAPQLVMSLFVSTHAAGSPVAGQRVSVPGQVVVSGTHFALPPPVPGTQVSVVVHALPHEPQLAGSLLRFLQPRQPDTPPHFVRPAAHVGLPVLHASLWQTMVPHAPQFFGSVLVSVQAPLHTVPRQPAVSVGGLSVGVPSVGVPSVVGPPVSS